MIPADAEPIQPTAFEPMAPVSIPSSAAARFRWASAIFGLIVVAAILISVGARSALRFEPDFEYFYKGGRALLLHGSLDNGYDHLANGAVVPRGRLDWYLPFVPRVMTLLAWMPPTVAAFVWLAFNLVALLFLLTFLMRRLTRFAPEQRPLAVLVMMLCLPLAWYWEFRLNQVDTLTLLLVVSSYLLWERGRHGMAGFWLGLAVLLKLTPILLVCWFALKRQFRMVAVALSTIALAGPAADVIALHPHYMAECYSGWASAAMHDASHAALIRAERETDWRNQGFGVVLARWLTHTDWMTHFDNEPRLPEERVAGYFNIADLSRSLVGRLATGLLALLLLTLAWFGRTPAARLSNRAMRYEWAICLLVILLAMPVLRRYHFVMVLPAMALILDALAGGLLRGARAVLAGACVLLFVAVQWLSIVRGSFTPSLFEAGGGLLLTIPLLMLPLLALRRSAIRPGGAPSDAMSPAGGVLMKPAATHTPAAGHA